MRSALKLNIYSIGVIVSADSEQLIKNLRNDFSFFQVKDLTKVEKVFTIEVDQKEYQDDLPKNQIISKQTENSLYIDLGNIRYNDYYGKALSIMDYENDSAQLYYQEINFVHELVYLMVLSLSGKELERRKKHKVHACGVHFQGKNLIMLMPSKGGKTTLFTELISDENVDIISDDTPLIDQSGKIYPFPLRIGHDDKEYLMKKFSYLNERDFVEFKREHYSKKYLLGLTKLKNNIKVGDKTILVQAFRSTYSKPKVKKISTLKMLKYTIEHMIIGIGLPMIVEYFLRNNLKDHILNFGIFLSRLKAAIYLVTNSKSYELYLTSNHDLNKTKILELFGER